MIDFTGIMGRARQEGWALVALDCVDTTTPAGEAMAHVLATFAHFERRLISQRTRDALAVKRAQGVQLGRRRELPDAIVVRIVAERAAGSTLTAIAHRLTQDEIPTAHGGQRWWPSTVRAVAAAARASTRQVAIRR